MVLVSKPANEEIMCWGLVIKGAEKDSDLLDGGAGEGDERNIIATENGNVEIDCDESRPIERECGNVEISCDGCSVAPTGGNAPAGHLRSEHVAPAGHPRRSIGMQVGPRSIGLVKGLPTMPMQLIMVLATRANRRTAHALAAPFFGRGCLIAMSDHVSMPLAIYFARQRSSDKGC